MQRYWSCKRLLGYSVWLLGSGLAAANHEAPKSVWMIKPTPTPLWHSEWKYPLWILVARYRQWLLGRGQWVLRWFRIGCLLPESNAHPHVFLHFYPEISFDLFQWKSMGRLLRCSKWLLGAWLDSFTDLWDADWSSESMSQPPCLYDTVIQSYVQLKSGFKSMGNFGTLCPPGVSFPIVWYVLTEPVSLFKCGKFHISTKSLSSYDLWILVAKVVDNGC